MKATKTRLILLDLSYYFSMETNCFSVGKEVGLCPRTTPLVPELKSKVNKENSPVLT